MTRTLLPLAMAVTLLVACKDRESAKPDPAATAATPTQQPAAQMPTALPPALPPPAPLSEAERAHLRLADDAASAALRARDRAKLKALGAPMLDVDGTLKEVYSTECLGDVLQRTGTDSELLVRHTLGFEPSADGKCQGVHEIQMHYTMIDGEPKLASVNRWGW